MNLLGKSIRSSQRPCGTGKQRNLNMVPRIRTRRQGSCQASAKHFQQCAEFPLLRNCGLRALAVLMVCLMRTIAPLALMALAACATDAGLETKTRQITPGMSTADVESILGAPQGRQFNGQREAWQYCQTGVAPVQGSDKYVLVWITNGRVTGMQTYTNKEHETCDSFFRSVKWEYAPDATAR
jgi:hypothetical protein